MAGCVLRVRKEGIRLESLLSVGIFPDAVRFKDGFNYTVSGSDEFEEQLRESEEFLKSNSKVLKSLVNQLLPEVPVLDYGLWRSGSPAQSVTFPSSLVAVAGDLGIELCATIYEANDL